MSRSASIIPSMMCKFLVSPPAHSGPRMVARPPTERLTPWLKPGGGGHGGRSNAAFIFCHVHDLTLRLFRRDLGEERHLGHGHEREAQQLQEDPDDEGRQLPAVATCRSQSEPISRLKPRPLSPVSPGPSHQQAGTGAHASIPAWNCRQAGSGRLFCSPQRLCVRAHLARLVDVPAPGANLITLMQLWRRGGYLPGSLSSFVGLI